MIRPAYPDELARARSLLNGHPVPGHASFLVAVKEQPVERLTAAIPWWQVPRELPPNDGQNGNDRKNSKGEQTDFKEIDLRYHLTSAGGAGLSLEGLTEALEQLEAIAQREQATSLFTDFALPAEHPLYQNLLQQGYEVCQTDRHLSIPGEALKSASLAHDESVASPLPSPWRIASIRGSDPQKIFKLIAAHQLTTEHQLISPQQFKDYWTSSRGEHFEEDYSYLVLDGQGDDEAVIALFLVSRRGQEELHIHLDCVHPDYQAHCALLSVTLRNTSFSQCPEGFPKTFSWKADAKKHPQTTNTALPQEATEAPPRHFLRKCLTQ